MITSRQNQLVRHMKSLGGDRKYRYECGEFIGAGSRCLSEAAASGARITAVLAVRDTPEFAGLPVTLVSDSILEYVSPLKTAQEFVFSCEIPDSETDIRPDGNYIVLDGVQDPGNVGTIIRTAHAFGMDAVLLLNGCADPYNPKTVRAAMGATFKTDVLELSTGVLREAVLRGLTLYGAAADGGSGVCETDLSRASVLVGSEGQGLSQEALSLCRGSVYIPMEPDAESLNAAVAASILLWEKYKKSKYE